ncbi:maltokinase N-terminal cap-like domain-containing protein [Yinghuangia seranimata]|uniref:maltokinase N-terminal cap-like domain-containing protein n=1 Tax=Yinghuangia seranimata TaxID=408067 RepID=UPI00248BEC0E|nr:phosphotransferase [Yinghuangia seranimata]MDI2128255.1 phosphotransferase [Yinghuangia seranimata]
MNEPTRPQDLHGIPVDAVCGQLLPWLPRQRWFAGKGRAIRGVEVVSAVPVVRGDPAMVHLVLAVEHEVPAEASQKTDHYQLLLGVRRRRVERLDYATIGRVRGGAHDGAVLYDAAHDPELTRWLLERFAAAAPGTPEAAGPLVFHRYAERAPRTELAGLVHGAEQSNTSIVFGDDVILKLFRRLTPGVNPDLELCLALADAGSRRVPQPVAWFEAGFGGETTTLGLVQEYLRTGTDGWELAKTSVRDLYADQDLCGLGGAGLDALRAHEVGGDFAGESFRLGVATAEVHADLARTLPTEIAGEDELGALAEQMSRRLDAAVDTVAELAPYADRLRDAYVDLAALGREDHPVPLQRIHGDFHLGQVMRTATRWVLIDFEGEPAQPLVERRAVHSPLRDIAAMLRSFDYAARHLLAERRAGGAGAPAPHLVRRAEEWAARNREAFCAGYAKAGSVDPRNEPVLLRAFETDKAVYEVVYESGNRPTWLPVPMSAIRRLADRAPQHH